MSKPSLIILPVGGLISALSLWSLFRNIKQINKEKIDFDITKFIRQPGYSEKRGYFQEVEEDLRDVMNILIANEYPAVIFIDDLDRCSPNTVAEVVEAINLFISRDFPKCFFILGQDAQMVAASLDVAYDKISLKSAHLYREQGSLGWHFMEKFVQLQFCIPVINDEISKNFFRNFFKRENGVAVDIDHDKILSEAKALEKRIDNSTNINDLLTAETTKLEENLKIIDPIGAVRLQEKIIIKAAEQYDDNDPEVQQLIEKLYNFIGPSPRSIKRFINLYRFYKFLQFTNRNVKLKDTTSIHLGQWIVCMIRWPQLVRAIQWNTDSEFVKRATALERAEGFETIFHKYDSFTEWAAVVQKEAPNLD